MSIFNGIAGKRAGNPVGVCFHNDAGRASANAGFMKVGYLTTSQKAVSPMHMWQKTVSCRPRT